MRTLSNKRRTTSMHFSKLRARSRRSRSTRATCAHELPDVLQQAHRGPGLQPGQVQVGAGSERPAEQGAPLPMARCSSGRGVRSDGAGHQPRHPRTAPCNNGHGRTGLRVRTNAAGHQGRHLANLSQARHPRRQQGVPTARGRGRQANDRLCLTAPHAAQTHKGRRLPWPAGGLHLHRTRPVHHGHVKAALGGDGRQVHARVHGTRKAQAASLQAWRPCTSRRHRGQKYTGQRQHYRPGGHMLVHSRLHGVCQPTRLAAPHLTATGGKGTHNALGQGRHPPLVGVGVGVGVRVSAAP
jgi:hypothetical protein